MRIISGKYKGFVLPPVKLNQTRPTTDRCKEALFNILQSKYNFSEKNMLDLYAGTGGIGFEFLSRGCQSVTFVDKNKASIQYIEKVANILDEQILTFNITIEKFLQVNQHQFDFIFADPPYADLSIITLINTIFDKKILKNNGLFILEHQHKLNISHPNLQETRNYGQSSFSFFIFEAEN